jgi:hypothetical protein
MRAIAAAKRLCQMSGARCTVVWDWQDYEALFARDPAIEVVAQIPPDLAPTYQIMQTSMTGTEHRCVPLDGMQGIILTSQHCFGATSDPKTLDEFDLLPWLPQPSQIVRQRVRQFKEQAFMTGAIAGVHMRRTDNRAAIAISPDWLFVRLAREIVDRGGAIYLATDNRATEELMLGRFGARVVCFPKSATLARRWPRAFDQQETTADYVDLLLLASCEYVLGSADSSYSMLAMALNGSPKCKVVRRLDLDKLTAMDRVQGVAHELRVAFFRLRQLEREHRGLKLGPAVLRELRKRFVTKSETGRAG